jgi:hypothetical protein
MSQTVFSQGDHIVVYCQQSPEWWNGAVNGKRGEFPSKVVHLQDKKGRRRKERPLSKVVWCGVTWRGGVVWCGVTWCEVLWSGGCDLLWWL